jgi:hypothetical protein
VKPHFDAVLTTRTTLPLRDVRGYSLPFSAQDCQQHVVVGPTGSLLSLGLKSKKVVAEDMVAMVLQCRCGVCKGSVCRALDIRVDGQNVGGVVVKALMR